jgi:hypothetical protein
MLYTYNFLNIRLGGPMCMASRSSQFSKLFLTVLFLCGTLLSGCSSGNMQVLSPAAPTKVAILVTSTANDQLTNFNATIASIQLADSAGNTVPLYINPNPLSPISGNPEFMRLNGITEPIAAASVPQGVYPTALVNITDCSFASISVASGGGLLIATNAQGICAQGSGQATVHLAAPIVISGSAMALSLNLQVSQSYTLSPNAMPPSYSISPTFTLTPFAISSQPNKELAATLTGITAQIMSTDSIHNSFVAQLPDGASITINANAATDFQGVAAFSTLAGGTLINLDLSIQPDASLLATRVEVDDLSAPMYSLGPYVSLGAQPGEFTTLPGAAQGCSLTGTPFCGSVFQYGANTTFGFSSQFTNLQDLPFTPTLTGSGLLFGQKLAIFTSGQFNASNFEPVSSAFLYPQVFNGTVTAVSSANNFTVYSVTLAPYDVIPALQGLVGPINRLTGATNVVQVYVDSNAQLLVSAPLAAGSLVRVRGLVFDDNGTLRMDANLVRDGVPE